MESDENRGTSAPGCRPAPPSVTPLDGVVAIETPSVFAEGVHTPGALSVVSTHAGSVHGAHQRIPVSQSMDTEPEPDTTTVAHDMPAFDVTSHVPSLSFSVKSPVAVTGTSTCVAPLRADTCAPSNAVAG